jgi:FHS family Na+ dependent glucose MFS transporter 1
METQNKRRIILYFTISLYVGISSAIFGPSLLKLVEQTSSSIKVLSYLFSGGAFTYLLGSWLAGRLFDRFEGHKLLFRILPVIGITLILVPFIQDPWILVGIGMVMTLAAGMVDVGGNTLLIRIQDIDLGPVMNGLHFFFGLGSFLAPLVLAGSIQATNEIAWGFWGFGLLIFLLLLQFIGLAEAEYPSVHSSESIEGRDQAASQRTVMILVIALFYLTFVGVEIGYGNWLSSYAFTMGLADESSSVLLTSLYWGSFTVSRLISIPLATRIKPRQIVIYDIAGSLLGLGMIFLFPGQTILLWIGTIILGASIASLFPTTLTYSESILKMSGKITSVFFISGSIGSILLPWVIGQTVEKAEATIIIKILFLTLCAAGGILLILLRLSKTYKQQ